mmetsp:Transcript_3220/g.7042  ORF Transcript_3220/g.7042 Transcript_3220/m.7042 type:complete len:545 (+) Transcript_3220:351-1985(+)|eukprot:CAMPEP_0202919840 /NCGR_PEP_ID=MMETSP1392-20130828/76542_1 /ASSEMBLY_ACC=CAM_ASM_000868 /TAXON_ID=225041 /ORGANISM="Chlamydomonas chlamydogama, Strain SAG 11-48b" /LENGTH=544 /DNA_ID=CAMNT_0049613301 /DNA_START=304 /DNA_END=1938 /DNA_ORIENTATION=-
MGTLTKAGAVALTIPVLVAIVLAYTSEEARSSWADQVQGALSHVPRVLHLQRGSANSSSDPVPYPPPASHDAVDDISTQGTGNCSPAATSPSSLTLEDADLAGQQPSATCHLQGTVDDCCNCTYEAVDRINSRIVSPLLTPLVQTAFFRYFKVNIYCDCPLWPDDSMCALRACSVCECDANEVPAPWLAAERGSCSAKEQPNHQQEEEGGSSSEGVEAPCDTALCAAELDSRVDRGMEPGLAAGLLNLKGWRGFNNPWMAEAEGGDEEYLYINLLANPERYTGYKGEHAHRIWSAIYSQSSLASLDSEEQRVFYRLLSGMHASISTHLSAHWLLDEEAAAWGPNLQEFERRLGHPGVRDRVQNLYFAYLFVLRAVMKAGPLLQRFTYYTGKADEDAVAAELVQKLVTSADVAASCPMPFDEGRLWKGREGPALKEQLQATFQNITRIMDCVGCEKCKLWGKLQTLGIATALKILFSSTDCDGSLPGRSSPFAGTLHLERNEVIALINLLERFSASIHYYQSMSAQLQSRQPGSTPAVTISDALV